MEHFRCFSTNIGKQPFQFGIGHTVPLAEIAHGGAQLAVGTTVLADDNSCQTRIGIGNFDRILEFFIIDKHGLILLICAVFPRPGAFRPLVSAIRRGKHLIQWPVGFLIGRNTLLIQFGIRFKKFC